MAHGPDEGRIALTEHPSEIGRSSRREPLGKSERSQIDQRVKERNEPVHLLPALCTPDEHQPCDRNVLGDLAGDNSA